MYPSPRPPPPSSAPISCVTDSPTATPTSATQTSAPLGRTTAPSRAASRAGGTIRPLRISRTTRTSRGAPRTTRPRTCTRTSRPRPTSRSSSSPRGGAPHPFHPPRARPLSPPGRPRLLRARQAKMAPTRRRPQRGLAPRRRQPPRRALQARGRMGRRPHSDTPPPRCTPWRPSVPRPRARRAPALRRLSPPSPRPSPRRGCGWPRTRPSSAGTRASPPRSCSRPAPRRWPCTPPRRPWPSSPSSRPTPRRHRRVPRRSRSPSRCNAPHSRPPCVCLPRHLSRQLSRQRLYNLRPPPSGRRRAGRTRRLPRRTRSLPLPHRTRHRTGRAATARLLRLGWGAGAAGGGLEQHSLRVCACGMGFLCGMGFRVGWDFACLRV
mmetsp:Transcript_51593/g.117672  ORF Transcript_51593/g.117672 Transcript_51593/m.117672 type:complete len:379 (-) Transcript_51593:61-1197(-)